MNSAEKPSTGRRYLVLGGAGFIGSHLVRELLLNDPDSIVRVYDNFSSGRMWHLEELVGSPRLEITTGDLSDIESLKSSMSDADVVYHLASNPDIAKAVESPDIDFWEGTYLTNNVLEAMRTMGVKKILYASGSGVYGDTGFAEVSENYCPMHPVSTYGASKLAGEALISAYCHMFEMTGAALRFANVVGPRQTHGVAYDFIKKLRTNPAELFVLGDGTQSKSYLYVSDVVSAMLTIQKAMNAGFTPFNVSTDDYLTVTEIADIVTQTMGLKDVKYVYSGGSRGWKGDVPVVRLISERVRSYGWSSCYNSRQAMTMAAASLYEDALLNRFEWETRVNINSP